MMKSQSHIRFLFCFLILILAFLPIYSFSENNVKKIGIVDIQFILENSIAIQNLKKKLGEINDKIQSDLSKKELELKNIEKYLVENKGKISEEKYNQEIALFNKKVADAQLMSREAKAKLESIHSEEMQKINQDLQKVIKDTLDEKDFDLIMPSVSVLHSKESLNITDLIIKKFNSLSLKKIKSQ